VKQDYVSISCATDHNYLCGTVVTLHSLCAHAVSVQSLHLHILDSGLTEADQEILRSLQTAFPEKTITISFHQVDLKRFSSLPPWRGGYAAYARMCLHELLPDEDFTVYTDVDTLWLRDVGELWEKRDASITLHAVPDGCGLRWYSSGIERAATFSKLGIHIRPEYYFCSGLLLMNLALMREDHFTERYFRLLKEHGGTWLSYPDQDIYNVLYAYPKTQLLDYRWGEFGIAYGLRGMQLPRVLHYAKGAP
jgi:lipopolysaccharide biosynthesis glycosyltransferase